MARLQIQVSEKEYERVYKILNKAMASFMAEKGRSFTIRSSIVRIFEEYGKWKGFINGNDKVATEIESIRSNPDELKQVEELIFQARRNPNVANARAINELVLKLDPNFRVPKGVSAKESQTAMLSVIADKLGVA